jgi:hypothetical protein
MTKLTLTVPTTGEKNTVAEPKVDTALKALEEFINGGNIDGTTNIKPTSILESNLATALQEKFTNRLGLAVEKPAGSETGESEKLYQMKNGKTLTLPAATLNRIVGVFALEAEAKVKTAAGVIKGDFFSGGTAVLTENQHLLLIADGTNWMIVAGEPKREQTYTANKVFSKAECEAGVEVSATRPAHVQLENIGSASTLNVGGASMALIQASETRTVYLNPGQTWKTNQSMGEMHILL